MQARTAVTMATASTTSPPRIKVKKELCADNESIKELAETAMNDILGWYGYDSVDRLETAASAKVASASTSTSHEHDEGVVRLKPDNDNSRPESNSPSTCSSSSVNLVKAKRGEAKPSAPTSSQHVMHQQRVIGGHFLSQDDSDLQAPSTSSKPERRPGRETPSAIGRPGSPSAGPAAAPNGIVLHHQAHPHHQHHHNPGSRGGGGVGDSSTSEKDSSRESSKSPMLMKMLDKQEQTCQWCRKVIPSHQTGILGTTEGMIFCTEACFSQSRRASFKRAKTCDWCRHVRHAVSYVDFQDGASQLQFCSDKCLNQYKMQIFCNETQAHLEMNPHLKEKSSSAGSLITPELWMKNCKSCSMSPVSDRSESVSPVPSVALRSSPEPSPGMVLNSPAPVKKALISVAPPSKLLSKSLQTTLGRPSPKSARKRRAAVHRPSSGPQSCAVSSKRSSSTLHQAGFIVVSSGASSLNAGGSGNNLNNNIATIPNNNLSVSSSAAIQSKPCTVISSSVQDLRMLQKKHVSSSGPPLGGFDGRESSVGGPLLPSSAPPPPPPLNIPAQFLPPPLNLLHPPFFHMNPVHLRFNPGLPNTPNLPQPSSQPTQQPPHPPPQMGPPPSPLTGIPLGPANRSAQIPNLLGLGPPPPVTILVPYPIIVPLPLPIPIPIPVIDFLRAALPKEPKEARTEPTVDGGTKTEDEGVDAETTLTVDSDAMVGDDLGLQENDPDTPLDFTVTSAAKLQNKNDFERSTEYGTTVSPSEQGTRTIVSGRPSDEGISYTLSTVATSVDVAIEEDDVELSDKRESGNQLLPKFKITRLGTRISSESGEGTVEQHEQDIIERERKEMVERSRPLRKRKRLVVQQHLETEPGQACEPISDGMLEESQYCSSVGTRTDQEK